jgi:alpha-D-xyloside xylohydrolase
MSLFEITTQPNGLLLHTGSGWLLISVYTNSILRIRYSLTGNFQAEAGEAVQMDFDEKASFSVLELENTLSFSTSRVTILINKRTLSLQYFDNDGNMLCKEPDRGGKTLEPVDVFISNFEHTIATESSDTADGVRIEAQNIEKIFDRKAYHSKLEFEWANDEALYGLGSHEEGMFNLRGQHQYLYQQNMKVVVPVLLSTKGYAIFLNSFSLITFHDDAFGSYLWSDVDDELDFFFVYGPEFDEIVNGLRKLSGPAPMLPRWAFGYIQSKERYTSQKELLDVVNEHRSRNLPLDCIVLDWKSWTGDFWGQKSFDPERFPNPDQMMEDFHANHVRMMISIWPIMRPGGENWRELERGSFLLGNNATYDAFNEKARECYWQQANAGLFSHGVDAWWCDCTEPFEADWKGATKPEPEERLMINTCEAKKYIDPEFINGYSMLHSKGIYEGQRKVTKNKRVFNLTRSSFLGQQRYSTVTWSGDVAAKWETLRHQVADGLNFSATSLPYWTTDIGGYFVKKNPDLWFWNGDFDMGVDDLAYRELYIRWFQFGTFLPIFRSHGTDTPREIWQFGKPGEPMYETLTSFLKFRYRLLPYIYSLAGWTTYANYQMFRMLAFDFRSDPNVFNVSDQYMFGPAFLVCPVTTPMYYEPGSVPLESSEKTREVYLPQGSIWYDFWNDKIIQGGKSIQADATLDKIPLYVRGGSIVPMGPIVQYSDECPDSPIEIHIFPGNNAQFELYEDDGDGYQYENGAFSIIKLFWNDSDKKLVIQERRGQFNGIPLTRSFIACLHGPYTHVSANEQKDMRKLVSYDGNEVTVRF